MTIEERAREAIWTGVRNNHVDTAGAVLSALRAAGLAIVPVEPTEAMLAAAWDRWIENTEPREHKSMADLHRHRIGPIYRAELAACQETPDDHPFGEDAVEAVARALWEERRRFYLDQTGDDIGAFDAPDFDIADDLEETKAQIVHDARAALAAARPFVDRWYPIETAPMSPVLYRDACGDIGHCAPMFVDDQFVGWWDEQRDDEATPVWWRPPLPAPPAEETPTESKGGE